MFICCLYFFFFKQKTAYEMRISDWSSDVCSSDQIDDALFDAYAASSDFIQAYIFPGGCLLSESRFRALAEERGFAWRGVRYFGGEIGSASCRESVCQYV